MLSLCHPAPPCRSQTYSSYSSARSARFSAHLGLVERQRRHLQAVDQLVLDFAFLDCDSERVSCDSGASIDFMALLLSLDDA